ncbi:MAG: cation:dicarboxylase symporter family transporter [Planctomycetales bacterium]|nr:cation:dicarboxylase symporter family transporter [Planctomycetales bacterium]
MRIALGLTLGVVVGVFLGEYCSFFEIFGRAYVGLLQMTVLPYLTATLIAKLGRLDLRLARQMGILAVLTLAAFWMVAIGLVVIVSADFPPIQGASFHTYSESNEPLDNSAQLERFIPSNIFRALTAEHVPAVVVFCLFAGAALMLTPGKQRVLDLLDLLSSVFGRINEILIRIAPLGLFTLVAAAAGTLRLQEVARLQAYLLVFALACAAAVFLVLPLLVVSATTFGYRELLRAVYEPTLTAFATGKLFVVLPQVVENCDRLLGEHEPQDSDRSTASIVVPLAYSFPHVGKILSLVFVSFAAWYVGRDLSSLQTAEMAAVGAVASFSSPLVTIPFLLDRYHLPQDLLPLFILPGFLTMRLADVVGVMHLTSMTLLVTQGMRGKLRVAWRKMAFFTIGAVACFVAAGMLCRWRLGALHLEYDLDKRLLALAISEPYRDVKVFRTGDEVPSRSQLDGTTLSRLKAGRVLRVGYHPDHLPYCFFNSQDELVGFDVELMHRLAARLDVRLEFVPYRYTTLVDQLTRGDIDLAIGGLTVRPERLLQLGFTSAYQTADIAVVTHDHRRQEFGVWINQPDARNLRLGVTQVDLAVAARQRMPHVEVEVIDDISDYFNGETPLDGLIVAAEEGAAWTVLYPDFTVVVPEPAIRRPVAIAVRSDDSAWSSFLDRCLDFERSDGVLERLRLFWLEGGGAQDHAPRWSVVRDVLGWVD